MASTVIAVTSNSADCFQQSGPTVGFETNASESSRVLLPTATAPGPVAQLRIINYTDDMAYIEFGDEDVIAFKWTGPPPLTCSYPMLPNSFIIINAPINIDLYLACINWEASGGMYVTPGLGNWAC
jgi:hypothetical protein